MKELKCENCETVFKIKDKLQTHLTTIKHEPINYRLIANKLQSQVYNQNYKNNE